MRHLERSERGTSERSREISFMCLEDLNSKGIHRLLLVVRDDFGVCGHYFMSNNTDISNAASFCGRPDGLSFLRIRLPLFL